MPIPWSEHPDRAPLKTSQPAERAFLAAGFDTVEKLLAASEKELLTLHGVGQHAIKRINEARTLAANP